MSKRDFRQIYFYELTLGRTSAQTAQNINEVWGQEIINECTVRNDSKSSVPATPASKTNHMTAVDNDPLKASVEADPRKTARDIAEELNGDHTTVIRHLKQIGKTKKLS
ncbi:unnamed protein product [Heligmosomoides polygyrus]|uniref:HTH_48 domain-containing protein n=1 Tax=Heligmosomoides polygyrus TaxID=6339 RepID=A0A183GXK6_HELPZ|nr:unnamed protein product [Heligmosomoides polygyrus]